MVGSLQPLNPFRFFSIDRKLPPYRLTILFGLTIAGGLALCATVYYFRYRMICQQTDKDNQAARSLLDSGNQAFTNTQFPAAVAFYVQALEKAKDPKLRAELSACCCKTYLNSYKFNEADASYEAAVKEGLDLKNKAHLALELGNSHEKTHNPDKARHYYEQARETLKLIDPASVEIFIECSKSYLKLDEFTLAMECCTVALTDKLDPTRQVLLRLQMGHIVEMQDKFHEATQHYLHAERLLDNSKSELHVRVWTALSHIYRKQQQFSASLDYCEKAVTAVNTPAILLSEARCSKSWALLDQNRLDEAETEADLALVRLENPNAKAPNFNPQIPYSA